MTDEDSRTSKLILAHASLSAALYLAASLRDHGPRRAATTFVLGVGFPAVGEFWLLDLWVFCVTESGPG